MRKILTSGVCAGAALAMVLASGTAAANDEYVGMTYEKAAENINQYGKAIIASRQGSYLPTGQCIVVGSRKSMSRDSSGNSSGYAQLLDLNCNDTTALRGHPGNSAATPEGQQAAEAIRNAKMLSKNYESLTAKGLEPGCAKDDNTFNWCVRVCKESDACSDPLLEFLGL